MSRLVAAVCLLAMLGSWTPHVHLDGDLHGHVSGQLPGHLAGPLPGNGDTHTDAATDSATPLGGRLAHVATVRSDDAHEEHSSRSVASDGGCALCRSQDDRNGDRAGSQRSPAASGSGGALAWDLAPVLPTPFAFGLHPTRAPPIA